MSKHTSFEPSRLHDAMNSLYRSSTSCPYTYAQTAQNFHAKRAHATLQVQCCLPSIGPRMHLPSSSGWSMCQLPTQSLASQGPLTFCAHAGYQVFRTKKSQRPGFLNWLKQADNQFAAVRLVQLSSRAFARIMFLCSAHMHPLAGSQDPCLEFMQFGLQSCRPNQPNMVGMTMVKHSYASDLL